MSTPYQTARNSVVSLTGDNTTLPSLTYALLLCSSEILRLMEDAGFCNISPTDEESAERPQFLAKKDGREACICFVPLCDFVLDIPHLSQAQCKFCDAQYPAHDVYYACLFCSGSDENRELELLGPQIVKRDGEWLRDELQHSQYLPLAMRKGMDRYSSIFNAGVLFKLYQVIFPVVAARCNTPNFRVLNLFDYTSQGETDYLALQLFDSPTLLTIVHNDSENKRLEYIRSLFMHCDGPTSDLELVSMPQEAEPADGQVELMEANGNYLQAECAEALLYRGRMQTGTRYLWHLSQVAEHIGPMKHEFSITSGPVFEIHCEEYRKEHGCEPPEGYAFRISTEGMRSFMQDEGDTYATVIGQVVSREASEVDGQPMTIITLRPMVDNDDVQLQVFVSPEVQGEYTPAEGDTVRASGYIYASAHELLVDVPSWQDSPEVGELIQERENSGNAHREYERLSRYSMGHAVAAAAFADGGWEILTYNTDELFSRHHPLMVKAQDGSIAVVCVDNVVNGQPTEPGYGELADLPDTIRKTYGEECVCYHCTVKLDYNTAAERYAISMEMVPECPGVENHLLYTAVPFRETMLCLDNGKPASNKRLRPAQLDEAMVATLFRDALAEGKWAAFAEWVREEACFESETCHITRSGKLSLLRYMSERVEMWKDNPQMQWEDFSFATGSIMHGEVRRPCMALSYRGAITAITVFEDKQGLIGRIHNLPGESFGTFIQND
ncbi:MAG: hypothetical protein IJN29_04565 [Akkermansia sp.]|nr:hypothetical protein [Akkermansia sp.]